MGATERTGPGCTRTALPAFGLQPPSGRRPMGTDPAPASRTAGSQARSTSLTLWEDRPDRSDRGDTAFRFVEEPREMWAPSIRTSLWPGEMSRARGYHLLRRSATL